MPSEGASMRPFAWVWFFYTIAVFVVALCAGIPGGLYKDMDFRSEYSAGYLARTDPSHLYDLSRQKQVQDSLVSKRDPAIPFGHLAYDALLYVPLSLLKYRSAYLMMLYSDAVLIILCFLAGRKEFSVTIPLWQPRPGLIFFGFMPTTIALAQGQDSLVLLLILCLTWKLLGRSQPFAAGLVLANLLLKPHLAVIMALFVAVRAGWRFVAGFATGTAAVLAICSPFLRHGGWRSWLSVISGLSLASGHNQAQETAMGISSWAMPNIRGALLLILGGELSSHALFALVCLVSLALVVWGLVVVRRLSRQNALAFSIIVTILVSYNFEPHDLVILLLAMVVIEIGKSKALGWCRDVILGLPIALLIFTPSTPPGAGFTLMSAPLIVGAFLLSRRAGKQGAVGATAVA